MIYRIRFTHSHFLIISAYLSYFNLQTTLTTRVLHKRSTCILPRSIILQSALLSLVMTDMFAFREHVLPRAIALYVYMYVHTSSRKKKEKKGNPCQSPSRGIDVQPGGDPRELAVYLFGRPLLSRAIDLPETSVVPASGPRSRLVAARPGSAIAATRFDPSPLLDFASPSLSLFPPPSRLSLRLLIRITHSEISRTTSGSRSSTII